MEPYLLPGGPDGCLLVHGFSGSPAETRGLGEYLAYTGCTVHGVRLAGHGQSPEVLAQSRWGDWLTSVETGFDALQRRCQRVCVVGFSLGGALAILLARLRHFDRLVLLNTPLALNGEPHFALLPVAHYIQPWYYPLKSISLDDPFVQHRLRTTAPNADLNDPRVQRKIRRSARIALRAVIELRKTMALARDTLPRVTLPVLVMHGLADATAPRASANEIMTRIGSREKQLVWWADTGHQLLEIGPHRQAIFERVGAFVTGG